MPVAKSKSKPKDQHKSGFLVRLPVAYRGKLEELRKTTRRPFTTEIQVALDAHMKANGVEPPDTST
jgi:hypothetical protein